MTIVFVLGSHRTGTKSLAGFFKNNFDDITSYHQYDLLRFVNVFSNMQVSGFLSEKILNQFLQYFWINRIKKHKTTYYVEANGFNYLAAQFAKKHFESVKIIHSIRDPRDFVTSYYNWVVGKSSSSMAKKMIPFWNIAGYRVGEFSKAEWGKMDTFQKFCWYWDFKNRKIATWYSSDANNYFLLPFEQLIHPTQRAGMVQKMVSFVGLSYEEEQLAYFDKKQNQSNNKILGKWPTWTQQQCQQLHQICGQTMQTYGYGMETAWLEKLHQL